MESDKKHIHHCLLFCFHQKKSATDAHRIICETYDENIIAISENWFKRFENNFDIKQRTLRMPCNYGRRQTAEKIMKNNGKYFD